MNNKLILWRSIKNHNSIFLLSLVFFLPFNVVAKKIIKVGIYNNPPKIEIVQNSFPEGMFIDIIEYIAKRENWDIKYICDNWDGCLQLLEKESIDLLPDVAFSHERAEIFDFNKIPVLYSWIQIYSRKGVELNKIDDLKGKKIGVLKNSIQERECLILKKKEIDFTIVSFKDYKTMEEEVANGKIDGIVVSRFYSYNKKKRDDILEPTPIILKTTSLHFVTKKNRNSYILSAVDKHISLMLKDPNSLYYKSFEKWFHEKPKIPIPKYIIIGLISITIIAIFFIGQNLILRYFVKERTKEIEKKNIELSIAIEQLKKAQEEALRRERLYSFGQLAMGIAHDFNNILQPILGWSEMMLNVPEELNNSEEVKESFKKIYSAAKYGSEIIKRMREIYKNSISQEKKSLVDLNSIINEVIELLKVRMGKNIVLNKQLCDNALINARKSEIHEMLLNLILNSLDAMPKGGTLEITTKNKIDTVEIIIKDNGIGMTEEIKRQCFQPFFTTKGEKGTGMGLTMVNNIVNTHGGNIEIESEHNKGTSFIINFRKG